MTKEQYEEARRRIADQVFTLKLKLEAMLKNTHCLYEGFESIDIIRGQIKGLEYALSTLRLAVEDEDALWH